MLTLTRFSSPTDFVPEVPDLGTYKRAHAPICDGRGVRIKAPFRGRLISPNDE